MFCKPTDRKSPRLLMAGEDVLEVSCSERESLRAEASGLVTVAL
jgi:hypothetical protein